ncbi:MAG: hypothetical protein DWQ04_19840 [Chloroflexi bacterium]|nr:MAG: hypothetical protein DWQ04_19840 [Chloroflexota bacterium]
METLPKFKLWEPLLILIGVAAGILWILNTLNTGNPLWFLPIQPTYEPSRIVIRKYGETVTIRRGEPGYKELSEGLNETLSSFNNTALISIGLSEDTLLRYNETELVVESYYADEIEFNTPVRMSGVKQLLIPIDATHAGNGYVFMGANGQWRVGAMVADDDTPLLNALRILGYLQD